MATWNVTLDVSGRINVREKAIEWEIDVVFSNISTLGSN